MTDITYVGRSEGDYFDLFHYIADGDRPVMELLVDPDCNIWIAGVTGLSIPQDTGFRVHRHRDPELEEHGIDTEHVCMASLVVRTELNIIDWLARVYVPVQGGVIAEPETGR